MKSFKLILLISFSYHALKSTDKNIYIKPFHHLLQQQTNEIMQEFQIIPEELYVKRNEHTSSAHTLFMVYMAADNNLHYFAWNNIKQMATIGSNNNVKIVIQLNEPGAHKKTQRYLIEKNKAILLNQPQVAAGKKFNMGDPKTLIDFCNTTIERFPTKHIVLVLWDHGTGYLDPLKAKSANIYELFQLNHEDMMLELNRNHEFIERIDPEGDCRGICFDETYHSYLSNQKIDLALKQICKKMNRKFDLIGLDACMMQMTEQANLLQPYTNLMVSSQEVELGAGWNYKHVLRPFNQQALSPTDLAKHIVSVYQKVYAQITHDYTLSAANLNELPPLLKSIHNIGGHLISCLQKQKNNSVRNTLLHCRSKRACTCFDEPSYLDLGHFYQNILDNLHKFQLSGDHHLINELRKELNNSIQQIRKIIFANVTGKNLKRACGISIYFPEKRIHSSYSKSLFASSNRWADFVQHFVQRQEELTTA